MLLENYAVRFQEAGYAVLAFDYRHFGQSGGEPRQLVSVAKQLEDYTASIEYVRNLEEIDPAKIALWGTSASGGYGIILAAEDQKIACVIGQCPSLDTRESGRILVKTVGLWHMVRLFIHGQRDMLRSRFDLSPHMMPIVGKPGTMAFFPIADAYEGYEKLASETFINEVCARILLRTQGYEPVKQAHKANCPILMQVCEYDSLARMSPETEQELKKYAEVINYPIGHFDIYTGDDFERAVSDQL